MQIWHESVDFWLFFSATVKPSSQKVVCWRIVCGNDGGRREALLWTVRKGQL